MSSAMTEKPEVVEADSLAGSSMNHQHTIGEGRDNALSTVKPFKLWSTLGIAYSITSTPLSIGTYLSVAIGVGGSPVFFYGYILTVLMNMTICVSLAEMAAILPHSGG